MAYEEASLDATTSARVDISCGRLLWDAYPCSVSRPTSRKARIMSGPRMLSKNVSLRPEYSLRVGYSSHVDLEYKSSWGRVYLYCLKRQEILKRRWMRSERRASRCKVRMLFVRGSHQFRASLASTERHLQAPCSSL